MIPIYSRSQQPVGLGVIDGRSECTGSRSWLVRMLLKQFFVQINSRMILQENRSFRLRTTLHAKAIYTGYLGLLRAGR
jgi:hypothetical protein